MSLCWSKENLFYLILSAVNKFSQFCRRIFRIKLASIYNFQDFPNWQVKNLTAICVWRGNHMFVVLFYLSIQVSERTWGLFARVDSLASHSGETIKPRLSAISGQDWQLGEFVRVLVSSTLTYGWCWAGRNEELLSNGSHESSATNINRLWKIEISFVRSSVYQVWSLTTTCSPCGRLWVEANAHLVCTKSGWTELIWADQTRWWRQSVSAKESNQRS